MLEHITNAIAHFGYWGIALLMLLENVIPPIPSEIIMPLAGVTVAKGNLNMAGAIAAGTVGTLLGTLVWFYIGKLLGLQRIYWLANRYGKWVGISGKEVKSVQRWFSQRGGYWSITLGRLLPSIRTYISVPAGIANMELVPFVFFSTLGSVAWITFLTGAGYYLGDGYKQIDKVLAPLGSIVSISAIVLIVGWILFQLYKSKVQRTL
ncbi:MAG: DedA family protein [Cyanobacteria bacterium P01_D01_bin.56]